MKRFVRLVIAAAALVGVSLAAVPAASADPVEFCGQIVGVQVNQPPVVTPCIGV